jgi:acyl-CoA reductase-like NAD-dependent aldehyde dehydrogenase
VRIDPDLQAPELTVVSPASGEVVGRHPVATEADVREAVERARELFAQWGAMDHRVRRDLLLRWCALVAERLDELVDLVRAETGKVRGDAVLEAGLALEALSWAARNARKVLGPRRVRSGVVTSYLTGTVEYHPLGVVGVIGPWNYPVLTPMGSIAYALAAGNTVVFKPSELTPGVGRWLADTCTEAVGRPVLQVVTGEGPTGAALCRAGVDKLAFTGSPGTARKVMAACAESLTPVVIEGGGKDALLVDEDADVAAAADAAVFGGMTNAGQTCIGVERVYAHEKVYDALVAEIRERAGRLVAGGDPGADVGPITLPRQVDVIREHVREALERGARAVVGGLESVGERVVQPIVLVDVPEDARAMTDETFGPVLAVTKVASMEEAVRRANATSYGLGSAVFSRRRGTELARMLRTGMTSVNNVAGFAGIPGLPFGGVGDSGFGRIHGADGLREFSYAKAIATQRFRPPIAMASVDRSEAEVDRFARIVRLVHRRPWRRGS